jgi:predicted nucleic-acid-binding Zn-ribbon protein
MKSGICPKCGARDIHQDGWRRCPRNFLPHGSFWGWSRVHNYVCVSCGYLESYIRTEDLEAVSKNWASVNPSKRSSPPEIE